MHSYLIVGKDGAKKEAEIEKLAKKLGVKLSEFNLAKIEDTRYLNSFLKLTVTKRTAILTKNADNATVPALNAFLKNLEEPQENLTFILTAESIHNLLPTIISRCQVIRVKDETKLEKKKLNEVEDFLKMSKAEKLSVINSIRERQQAINFVKETILGAHQLLLKTKGKHKNISKFLKSASKTLNNLQANGNVALQLTNFVLNP